MAGGPHGMVLAEPFITKLARRSSLSGRPRPSLAPLELVELRHRRRDSALTQLVGAAHRLGVVGEADVLLASLLYCERVMASGLGRGVAVPQVRSLAVIRPFLVVGRAIRGLDWAAFDAVPVQLVILVLSPGATSAQQHLGRVAGAAHAARTQRTRARIMAADAAAALALLGGGGA